MPMSAVPPSPANATTVTSSLPCRFSARLIPDAQMAEVSKRTWRLGTLNALKGYMSLKMSRQEAGMYTTVLGPRTLRLSRTTMAPPQPGHAVWPETKRSSWGSSLIVVMGSPPASRST